MDKENKRDSKTDNIPAQSRESSRDELLLLIQRIAFIIMIIIVLCFFPVLFLLPRLVKIILIVFLIAAVIGFGIMFLETHEEFSDFKAAYIRTHPEEVERIRKAKEKADEDKRK